MILGGVPFTFSREQADEIERRLLLASANNSDLRAMRRDIAMSIRSIEAMRYELGLDIVPGESFAACVERIAEGVCQLVDDLNLAVQMLEANR